MPTGIPWVVSPGPSLQNRELKWLFVSIEDLGICQKVLEAQNLLIYYMFCLVGGGFLI